MNAEGANQSPVANAMWEQRTVEAEVTETGTEAVAALEAREK